MYITLHIWFLLNKYFSVVPWNSFCFKNDIVCGASAYFHVFCHLYKSIIQISSENTTASKYQFRWDELYLVSVIRIVFNLILLKREKEILTGYFFQRFPLWFKVLLRFRNMIACLGIFSALRIVLNKIFQHEFTFKIGFGVEEGFGLD